MEVIQSINDVLGKLDKVSKDGIPMNHSVDTKTVTEFGLWILGGLLLAGIAAGTMVGLFIKRK